MLEISKWGQQGSGETAQGSKLSSVVATPGIPGTRGRRSKISVGFCAQGSLLIDSLEAAGLLRGVCQLNCGRGTELAS